VPFEDIPAEESTGHGQESSVNVGSLLMANSQSTKLIQPSKSPFHNPSPSPQSTAMFSVALCKKRYDAAGTQTSPDCVGVITAIA
jgi:hypothetical protein